MNPMPCIQVNAIQGARLIRLGDRSWVVRTFAGVPMAIWDSGQWVRFVRGEARLMGQMCPAKAPSSPVDELSPCP